VQCAWYNYGDVKCVSASHHHTHKDQQSGHSAAETEMTHPAGSEAYEELDMTSPTQPVYSQIRS